MRRMTMIMLMMVMTIIIIIIGQVLSDEVVDHDHIHDHHHHRHNHHHRTGVVRRGAEKVADGSFGTLHCCDLVNIIFRM